MYQMVPPPQDADHKGNDIADPETVNSCEKAPKNVPSKLWERFKVLEKKTDDMTRRSTEKRTKYMQKSLMKKVQEEITLPEDRDILRQHDVKFGPPVNNDTDQVNRKRKSNTSIDPSTQEGPSSASGSSWENIKPYLTAEDHLERPDKDFYKPKSGLEGQITSAIKQGEFSKAEELSDQLSTRELGSKVSKAFDAHRFVEKRKEQEDFKKSKKKKSLHWGFQEKQRWETKGNM
ncbi:protein FAM204A-like [Mizuhopecten yessoensis]|uniref:protein FAM204A-like n=1 Tax=Mizuhopecten yessoensis TaxID=6573 RepID=UPI000B457DDE|nr:protein FAM204A-like [Mizuhopecten yessoensis]